MSAYPVFGRPGNAPIDVGEIRQFDADPGTDWLRCNGGVFDSSAYPGLAIALPPVVASNGFVIRSTTPVTDTLTGIVYFAGLFIAVGVAGACITSPDGETWTSRAFISSDLATIAASPTRVVAARSASTTIFYSSDGLSWTSGNIGAPVNKITWTGSMFVGVGDSGNIRTSPDGITWTARTGPVTTNLNDVASGNGLIVATTSGNSGSVQTSTDGITWTQRAVVSGVGNGSVHFSAGLWVVSLGNGNVATSHDAITWTQRQVQNFDLLVAPVSTGQFSALITTRGVMFTSVDRIAWSATTVVDIQVRFNSSVFADNKLVMAGLSGRILVMKPELRVPLVQNAAKPAYVRGR